MRVARNITFAIVIVVAVTIVLASRSTLTTACANVSGSILISII